MENYQQKIKKACKYKMQKHIFQVYMYMYVCMCTYIYGAWGSVVVKAMRY